MVKLIYLLFLLYYLPANSVLADGIIKEQTLPTSPGKTLYVKAQSGDVTITSREKDEAYIKITGNDNAKENYEYLIEEKNGDIYITVSGKSSSNWFKNIKLKIEVTVPGNYNAEISSSGGDMDITGINGNLSLKTAGGDIKLQSISGKSEIKTAGGDIKVSSFSGELNAKTAGGDIEFTGSDCKISAKTSGGNIIVKYSGENKGIELASSGGDIKLFLPESISANIDFSTSGGEIKSALEISGKLNTSKTKIKGKINNGGEQITCKSNGGNITIEKL
jgi:hypothetical protein